MTHFVTKHRSNLRCLRRHQSGLTMVELLVAAILAIFLIGGSIQIFTQSKTSYKLQEGIARAQENGRLALYFIEKEVRRAAYPLDNLPQINGFARDQVSSTGTFNSSDTIPVDDSDDDSIVIQFKAPTGGVDDCTGTNVPSDTTVAMHFFLNNGVLTCESVIDGDNTLNSVALIPDLAKLKFTYGVDSDGDGAPNGDYVAASGGVDWPNVVAVRVMVEADVVSTVVNQPGTRTKEDLVYSTTIPIRNQAGR